MEYKIVHEGNIESLVKEVNKPIKKGWVPQGGVSILHVSSGLSPRNEYSQAMIKKQEWWTLVIDGLIREEELAEMEKITELDINRIQALTDAIFAVVSTLLINV